MATHSIHADVHTNGLADDCERCVELASRPLELDETTFLEEWGRMIEVEWGDTSYRSANEATLCRDYLYAWALFLERYTPIDPRELPEQLAAA